MTQQEKEERINELHSVILVNEALLQQEDYKVIKCAEAKVQETEMPYDTNELIARRNEYRSIINQAQEEIERLESLDVVMKSQDML